MFSNSFINPQQSPETFLNDNQLTGNHPTDNEVQIMHTSAQSSSYGNGSSMPSTVRGCGQGMDARQLPPSGFQPSANPVLAETFERHWQQLRGIAAHNVRLFCYITIIVYKECHGD